MAEKSTFFNSVNGDREYTAEDMAAHFAKMLTNGVMPAGTQLQVIEGGGMNVAVSAGSAWINGYAYHNDASFVLAIDPADGVLNRVDRIVVRWSKLARSINLTVLKGKPASSATAPDIVRNEDYYDLSIATINVNKGITAITQALITDTRMDSDVCGFVSSLIQPDTSGWFVQFETAFNEWFDGVKDTLGDNAAGQLQNQINQLKALENKLPDDLATTLGLDPADDPRVKDGFKAVAPWRLLKTYTVAGAYTFTVPDGISELGAFIIGGGASGSAVNNIYYSGYSRYYAGGGASGHSKVTKINNPNGDYSVVVGAGGKSVSESAGGSPNSTSGKNGGSSSFNGIIAEGGEGGRYAESNTTSNYRGASGGQGSASLGSSSSKTPAFGEVRQATGEDAFGGTIPTECLNPFDENKILIAGGFCSHELAVTDEYGNIGSAGATKTITSTGMIVEAVKGTSYGCGGGGAAVVDPDKFKGKAISAAGCDGAVLIYGR